MIRSAIQVGIWHVPGEVIVERYVPTVGWVTGGGYNSNGFQPTPVDYRQPQPNTNPPKET